MPSGTRFAKEAREPDQMHGWCLIQVKTVPCALDDLDTQSPTRLPRILDNIDLSEIQVYIFYVNGVLAFRWRHRQIWATECKARGHLFRRLAR